MQFLSFAYFAFVSTMNAIQAYQARVFNPREMLERVSLDSHSYDHEWTVKCPSIWPLSPCREQAQCQELFHVRFLFLIIISAANNVASSGRGISRTFVAFGALLHHRRLNYRHERSNILLKSNVWVRVSSISFVVCVITINSQCLSIPDINTKCRQRNESSGLCIAMCSSYMGRSY